MTAETTWIPEFYHLSPAFEPLAAAGRFFADLPHWPRLPDYARFFKHYQLPLIPVPQDEKARSFEQLYESRIYLQQEIQIKLNGWHDFFNALCWAVFPRSKGVLNQLHFQASRERSRGTNRSPRENTLALLDESGMLVISDRPELLDMIRQHQWQALFLQHRADFQQHCRCLVYGHAMYEKLLQPYVGMTAKALLIDSKTLLDAEIGVIDSYIAEVLSGGQLDSPSRLAPLPVLGVPGWYEANNDAAFYANQSYFRP